MIHQQPFTRLRNPSSLRSRTWPFLVILAASALLLSRPGAVEGQTPFTYQGRLDSEGIPHNGTVTLRLSVWGFPQPGFSSALRTEVISNVTVIDGLFTATPTTFVAADFGSTTFGDWLEIEVSTDGGSIFTKLAPRQRVSYAPLALNAERAKSLIGTLPGSQISGAGTLNPSVIGSGTTTGTINFNPAGGSAPFSITNSSAPTVLNLSADKLDGLDSLSFLRTSGGTLSGSLSLQSPAAINFGNITRQMLNLYNADYGIGVQTDTLYQRSGGDFSWFRGGIHNDVRNSAGGGTEMMRLTDSTLWLRPGTTSLPRGRLLFGDFTGPLPFAAIGEATDDDDVLEITGQKVRIRSNNGTPPVINFGATTGQFIELFQNATDTYGIGVQGFTEYFRTGSQFAWFKDGVHSDTAGDPGAGGSLLAVLDSSGSLQPQSLFTNGPVTGSFLYSTANARIEGDLTVAGGAFIDGQVEITGNVAGVAVRNRGDQSKIWTMYSRNSGATDQLAFYSGSSNRDVAAFSPNGDLYLVGALTTTVLTIRGGADVAEPFEMTNADELEPGSVVVIDENNPGKLRLSTEAYDTRVAGIVSGAGGVKPGLRLQQDGVMEGDHHVALSGRVYVKADAANGAIKPGDLLTTCENPGHAARVTNSSEAQGAILGKAMSKLDRGTGLVLVLVTLQ